MARKSQHIFADKVDNNNGVVFIPTKINSDGQQSALSQSRNGHTGMGNVISFDNLNDCVQFMNSFAQVSKVMDGIDFIVHVDKPHLV